jgi:hypothetical protein
MPCLVCKTGLPASNLQAEKFTHFSSEVEVPSSLVLFPSFQSLVLSSLIATKTMQTRPFEHFLEIVSCRPPVSVGVSSKIFRAGPLFLDFYRTIRSIRSWHPPDLTHPMKPKSGRQHRPLQGLQGDHFQATCDVHKLRHATSTRQRLAHIFTFLGNRFTQLGNASPQTPLQGRHIFGIASIHLCKFVP